MIPIFLVQTVTFRVEIHRGLPKHVEAASLLEMLANVFYGISWDEDSLFVNSVAVACPSNLKKSSGNDKELPPESSSVGNLMLMNRSRAAPLLKDCLNRFFIHQDIRCIPNQDLLALMKGSTDETLVER